MSEQHAPGPQGHACACSACKDAFHAHVVGTTTGPIGATTGYTITNSATTPEA